MKRGSNNAGAGRSYRIYGVAVLVALLTASSAAGTRAAHDQATDELVAVSPGSFWAPDSIFNPTADDGLPITWGTAETFFASSFEGPQPALASGAKQIKPKTWAVSLRPGVRFQNGKRLDARAAVAYLRYELKNDPVVGSLLPDVTAIKVVNNLTFTLTTKKPLPYLPAVLVDLSMAVYDVATIKRVAPNWNKLVGSGAWTGPFSLTGFQPGRRIVVTQNRRYWGGRPLLKRVTLVSVPDSQAALRAVQAGESDMYLFPPGSVKVAAQAIPTVHWVTSTRAPGIFAATFNLNKPPMNDVAVRRAFSNAIDWATITRTVLFGVYPPLKGLYPSSDPVAVDWQRFDPALANRQLTAAGWTMGSDGVRVKGGQKLELTMIIYSDDQKIIATAAQDMLKKIGIDSQIVGGNDYEVYLNNVKENRWDVGFYQGFRNYGFSGVKQISLPEHFLPDSTRVSNPSSFDDAEIKALVPEFRSKDPKVVANAIRKLQRINARKVYWVGIAQRVLSVVVNDEWKGYKLDAFFRPFGSKTKP
jgi:peptide/nickel transport system substrate-binding protein